MHRLPLCCVCPAIREPSYTCVSVLSWQLEFALLNSATMCMEALSQRDTHASSVACTFGQHSMNLESPSNVNFYYGQGDQNPKFDASKVSENTTAIRNVLTGNRPCKKHPGERYHLGPYMDAGRLDADVFAIIRFHPLHSIPCPGWAQNSCPTRCGKSC